MVLGSARTVSGDGVVFIVARGGLDVCDGGTENL